MGKSSLWLSQCSQRSSTDLFKEQALMKLERFKFLDQLIKAVLQFSLNNMTESMQLITSVNLTVIPSLVSGISRTWPGISLSRSNWSLGLIISTQAVVFLKRISTTYPSTMDASVAQVKMTKVHSSSLAAFTMGDLFSSLRNMSAVKRSFTLVLSMRMALSLMVTGLLTERKTSSS